jgi:hypothetical protein
VNLKKIPIPDDPRHHEPEPAAVKVDPKPAAVSLDGTPAAHPRTSPARALQDALAAEFGDARPEKRWPRRTTLAFVLATCGAFWAAVGAGLSILTR